MRKLKYKLFWLILNALIFISLTSLLVFPPEWFFGPDIGLPELLSDKVVHILVFTILTIWVCGQIVSFINVLLYISFYGIIIECIQYFSPYRTYELLDIVANEIGIILGFVISYIVTKNWIIEAEDLISNLCDKKHETRNE